MTAEDAAQSGVYRFPIQGVINALPPLFRLSEVSEARVREIMREELAAHEKRKAEDFRQGMRGHLVQLQEQLNESKAKLAVKHGHVPQMPVSDRLLADIRAAVDPPIEHRDADTCGAPTWPSHPEGEVS